MGTLLVHSSTSKKWQKNNYHSPILPKDVSQWNWGMAPLQLHPDQALICACFRYLHPRSCDKGPIQPMQSHRTWVPKARLLHALTDIQIISNSIKTCPSVWRGTDNFLWECPIKIKRGHSQTLLFSQPAVTPLFKHPRRQFQGPMRKKQNCDQTPPGSSYLAVVHLLHNISKYREHTYTYWAPYCATKAISNMVWREYIS